jgi:hypothetical protein
MSKIHLNELVRIIREELKANLKEGADHDAASKQMTSATKLLGALESFKETASEKIKSELGQCIEDMEKLLNRVIASPMQYVDTVKQKEPQALGKKVTLKPSKTQNLV